LLDLLARFEPLRYPSVCILLGQAKGLNSAHPIKMPLLSIGQSDCTCDHSSRLFNSAHGTRGRWVIGLP
jgi:hypothetical protein